MRLLPLLILAVLLLPAPRAARGENDAVPAADGAAIRSVIQQQIAAFARDDGPAAFGFASPAIQQEFGSPETFMRMVETGYRAVYRPRSVAFGAARAAGGMVVQEVDVVGPDGLGVRAFYLMERESDGSWRINGVRLTPGNDKET